MEVDVLLCALPCAFERDMAEAFGYAIEELVAACRRRSSAVMKLDVAAGERLVEGIVRVQQVLVAMLGALDEDALSRVLLPWTDAQSGTRLLASAVRNKCTMLLASPLVQGMLEARWRIILPNEVAEFSQRQWLGEAEPPDGSSDESSDESSEGSSDKTSKQKPPAEGTSQLWWELLLALGRQLLLLVRIALYPPAEEAAEWQASLCATAAAAAVNGRNPMPDADNDGLTSLEVDGVEVSFFYDTDPDDEQQDARKTFFRARATVAKEEARLSLRDFPLMMPEAKFWLQTVSKLTLAATLTIIPIRRLSTASLLGVEVWLVQIVLQEASEAYADRRLYTTDPLNLVELIGAVALCAGVLVELLHGAPPQATVLDVSTRQLHREDDTWSIEPLAAQSANTRLGTTAGFEHVMLGAGVAMLWIAQWWRMMLRSSTLGPLVLMVQLMFVDVAYYLLLMAGPMLGFSAAMITLYAGSDLEEDCVVFDADDPSGGFFRTLIELFEVMLGFDIPMGCLHESDMPVAGPLFMILYLVMVLLLALNMLIGVCLGPTEPLLPTYSEARCAPASHARQR
jgi:hypothetical protein